MTQNKCSEKLSSKYNSLFRRDKLDIPDITGNDILKEIENQVLRDLDIVENQEIGKEETRQSIITHESSINSIPMCINNNTLTYEQPTINYSAPENEDDDIIIPFPLGLSFNEHNFYLPDTSSLVNVTINEEFLEELKKTIYKNNHEEIKEMSNAFILHDDKTITKDEVISINMAPDDFKNIENNYFDYLNDNIFS